MKRIFFLLCMFQSISLAQQIETERTIWVPWTTEHTYEWEKIEQNDSTISMFHRNQYFENIHNLVLRDANWLQLRAHMIAAHKNTIFFPDLGFAVLRKSDHMLIGLIRTKLSENSGVLNFSYGLRPEVRNDKFGQEIIKTFTTYIDQLLTIPVITFKHETDRSIFMAAWRTEGIKEQPDFDYLASFFDENAQPLRKVIGFVDAQNLASLIILMRHSMQPFALECDQYTCADGRRYFSYDFLLQYPSETQHPCNIIEELARNLLSRDDALIYNAHRYIVQLFNVDSSWNYMLLSRTEKAELKLIERSSLRYDCMVTKNIGSRTYYPPYCFVKY